MPLSNYQFEFTRNFEGGGSDVVLFGAGTNIDVERTSGLHEQAIRDGDRAFTRFHGDIPGDHTIHPKTIEFDVEVRGDPTLTAYWDDVYEVVEEILAQPEYNASDVLKYKFPDTPEKFIRCRVIRRNFQRTSRTEFGLAPIQFAFKAADPRSYFPTTVGTPNTSGASSGTFAVTNDGNANAYPILTFTSTGANAKLVNNTFGGQIAFTSPPSGTLVADMDRYIRGEKGLIIYVGSANHYDKWDQARVPFVLGRGSNSLTLTDATNVTVQWYDTWL